jgi:hypothetical protein
MGGERDLVRMTGGFGLIVGTENESLYLTDITYSSIFLNTMYQSLCIIWPNSICLCKPNLAIRGLMTPVVNLYDNDDVY